MARRYVDMLPIAEWANALLVFLRVPLANRQPSHVAELGAILRRVMEDQAVEHYTPAELAALARFYATPAGRSIARKSAAFSAAVTRAQTAEVVAWARTVGAPIEPQASAGRTLAIAPPRPGNMLMAVAAASRAKSVRLSSGNTSG